MRWIVLDPLLWVILFSVTSASATGVKEAVEPALSEMGEHFRHLNFPAEIQRSWVGSSLHWLFAMDRVDMNGPKRFLKFVGLGLEGPWDFCV